MLSRAFDVERAQAISRELDNELTRSGVSCSGGVRSTRGYNRQENTKQLFNRSTKIMHLHKECHKN